MSDPRHPEQGAAPGARATKGPQAGWLGYAIAAAAAAAAALLQVAVYGLTVLERGRIPFIFFFGAVMLAARYGGRGPGLVSILLSALAAGYFFLPPFNTLALDREGTLQVAVFIFVALLIVHLTEKSIRAEAEARASEESLATTLQSIGDAVIATDTAGRITFINPVAERLTSWAAAEARGRRLTEVFRILDEGTRREVESPVEKVLGRGAVVGLANHTILISKGGTEIPIDDSGAPIKDAKGRITGVVLVFHDITERRRAELSLKESEERFRTVAESASDAIVTIDEESRIVFVNGATGKIFGHAAPEMIGRSLTMLMPEYLRHIHRAGLERYIETGNRHISWESVELPGLHRDGHEILLELSFGEFVREGRRYFTGVVRDITRRKQAEHRLAAQHAVTRVLAESATLREAAPGILRTICENLDWSVAAVWVVDEDAGVLRCVENWHAPHVSAEEFIALSRRTTFAPGVGLPGRVWASRAPAWIADVTQDSNFPRAPAAAREGLRAAFCVPILLGGEFLGVLEFFHPEIRPPDGELLDMMSTVGSQIGQFIERTRAEQVLRESEERYRALADAMPQIVWTARADGYFDYYNQRWYDYTGLTLEQTRGWGWQPVLHPEDAERCLRRWARAVQTGEGYEIEYRFRRAADGEYRWHLGRAAPMRDAEGRVLKWFGTATDIHDHKLAEEQVSFLAEANALLTSSLDYETTLARLARLSVSGPADHCVIDLLDDDGRVRRVATTHADEAKEGLVRDLIRFPPAPGKGEGIPAVLRTGRPEFFPEVDEARLQSLARGAEHLEALRRLGPKSFMTVPLNARGRTMGAITLGLDGPGRHYTRADLAFAEELARRAALAIDNARLYSRAQEANRLKDEFLATLSHELRTPLTPIIGWTHMLRDGRLDQKEVAQGLEVISKNSETMLRLVSDLLDMTSILSGKMRIERAPVELAAVVREAAETIRPQAEASGVALELPSADGAAPIVVSGDRTRLVQVFWNLLSNAVKFSRTGGRVLVECDADNATARVEIVDDGSGIEPDFLPRVFDRFTQADSSTRRAHGGLGIGLALVRSFVEAHGGVATAASAGPGRGSRFTVTLPRVRTETDGLRIEADSLAGLSASGRATTVPATNPPSAIHWSQSAIPRVLVIEDARDTLDLLRVVFGMRNYEAVACSTAEEALRVAPSARFDIIVSDIGLPRIDGYELLRRLRQIPHLRDTPALALTGYAAPKDAEAALAAGFDAHVAKPVEPSALAEAVERLLERNGPTP